MFYLRHLCYGRTSLMRWNKMIEYPYNIISQTALKRVYMFVRRAYVHMWCISIVPFRAQMRS